MKIKKFKKKVYLIPVAVCILGILLLGYYFFMDSFSKVEETTYVYIDDNDNIDSVCAKLSPIAQAHTMMAFQTMARHGGYAEKIRTGRFAIVQTSLGVSPMAWALA